MKVLHVIPVIAPRYGGPSSAIIPLCRALDSQPGIEIALATTNANGPGAEISSDLVPSDFPVHVFKRVVSERWQYSPELGYRLGRHAGSYDLIHVHALWTHVPSMAARTARKAGVPYIPRPAGMLSPYTFSRKALQKRISWQLFERRTVNSAAAIHVTSEQEKADVRRVAANKRVFVISNGVEEAAWSEPVDSTSFRAKLNVANDRPMLLFLSRLHPKKGITDRLLPAVAKLHGNPLLVIAGGEDERSPGYEDQIRRSIADLKLESRVRMVGPIEGDGRWALFDAADAFVLPSHSENFGIVVAEAMARRCPVVVTDSVQSCSHVRAAGAGKVVSGDICALSNAIDDVVANPERKNVWGEAGRQYAETHFRWSSIAEQVRSMYESCLAVA